MRVFSKGCTSTGLLLGKDLLQWCFILCGILGGTFSSVATFGSEDGRGNDDIPETLYHQLDQSFAPFVHIQPLAPISEQSNTQVQRPYRLALGRLTKIDGDWQIERSEQLDGTQLRKVVEIPRGTDVSVLLDSELLAIQEKYPARLLYTCRGLDCGSSNAWANTHFGVKQLYGLDVSQVYHVWELNVGEKPAVYLTVYHVKRGNHRQYLLMDLVRPTKAFSQPLAVSNDILAERYYQEGQLTSPNLLTDQGGKWVADVERLQLILSVLNKQPYKPVYVSMVGYADEQTVYESLVEAFKNLRFNVRRLKPALNVSGDSTTPGTEDSVVIFSIKRP